MDKLCIELYASGKTSNCDFSLTQAVIEAKALKVNAGKIFIYRHQFETLHKYEKKNCSGSFLSFSAFILPVFCQCFHMAKIAYRIFRTISRSEV